MPIELLKLITQFASSFKSNLKRVFSIFVFSTYIVNRLSNFFPLSSNENVSEKRAAVLTQNFSFKRKLDIEDHCFMIHGISKTGSYLAPR